MGAEKVWACVNLRRAHRNLEPVSLQRIQRILRYVRGHDAPQRSPAFDLRLPSKPDSKWDSFAPLEGARLYHGRR